MAQKMLIDATHAEETRVVVVDGNRVEEFDFETASRRQLAGNIYLAKVTRVEPSLQAAFVDYGGNRHGFLAFSEIHPDYYQIPAADRAALIAEEQSLAAQEEEGPRPKVRRSSSRRGKARDSVSAERAVTGDRVAFGEAEGRDASGMDIVEPVDDGDIHFAHDAVAADSDDRAPQPQDRAQPEAQAAHDTATDGLDGTDPAGDAVDPPEPAGIGSETAAPDADPADSDAAIVADTDENGAPYVAADHAAETDDQIESVADDDVSDEVRPPRRSRQRRYKIQEVIKVRQIMLVQVVKEERGNKGAALTTYLSLAGRYCVLMPNTARGGGISRKITNATDRKKLKEIAGSIEVPQGAGLIIRTAGAKRTKSEIKRDYEYLFRLWEQIRDLTLKSIAPAPIYEEGDLIKRSIRDLYSRNIEEVLVEGADGYRVAKDFMKMIMPSHARHVKQYQDPMPLFARFQVESTLSSMFNPTVQLKSGGYIVIGVTEALVAIDVNSGKATKEGSIEETALKTNLEAAEEIARQLRLRDLAGLIVIDFIDMEERRNNASVEKILKDKLKTDRARIQVGRISGFGLLEMSRQRLRPGMLEATTQPCPHCHGTGLIRSDESLALTVLRQLEEEGTRKRAREVLLKAPVGIVNFLINQKREHIAQIEARYGMAVRLAGDPQMVSPDFSIEKFKTATRTVTALAPVVSVDTHVVMDAEIEEDSPDAEALPDDGVARTAVEPPAEGDGDNGAKRKRRRRRRRRAGGSESGEAVTGSALPEAEASDKPDAADAGQGSDRPKAQDAAGPSLSDEAAPVEAPADAAPTDDATGNKPAKPARRRGGRGRKAAAAEAGAQEPATQTDATAEDVSDPATRAGAVPASPVPERMPEPAPEETAPEAVPDDPGEIAPPGTAVAAEPQERTRAATHPAPDTASSETAASEAASDVAMSETVEPVEGAAHMATLSPKAASPEGAELAGVPAPESASEARAAMAAQAPPPDAHNGTGVATDPEAVQSPPPAPAEPESAAAQVEATTPARAEVNGAQDDSSLHGSAEPELAERQAAEMPSEDASDEALDKPRRRGWWNLSR